MIIIVMRVIFTLQAEALVVFIEIILTQSVMSRLKVHQGYWRGAIKIIVGFIGKYVIERLAGRGLTISMDGGTVVDILPIFAGLLAWSMVLGFIGQRRLQKRFA